MKFGSCPKDLHCVSTWIFLLFCPEPPNQNIVKNSAQCTYLVKSVLKYHSFYVLRWYIEEEKIKICIFLSISGFVLIWRFQNRQFRPILVVFLVPLWHQNDHQYWSKLEDSLGGCWGCMWKSNFLNQKVLAISKVKNSPFTFSIPAPEASPVLTLGISSKGQVQTRISEARSLDLFPSF